MHSYASLLSLSPPAPHTRTHPHSSTISFTAETDRGEAEWIKVRFDTRGYILLPNHDQASSLAPHSLPGLAEWAIHRLWAMQNLRGGTWLCVFSMFCHTWGFSNPQSTTSRLASMRSVACRASYQRVQRIVVSSHTQAKGLPPPQPLVKQASPFTSCGTWSEWDTMLLIETFLYRYFFWCHSGLLTVWAVGCFVRLS